MLLKGPFYPILANVYYGFRKVWLNMLALSFHSCSVELLGKTKEIIKNSILSGAIFKVNENTFRGISSSL